MPPIPEHSQAVLTIDLPEFGLVAGDVGVVVHVYANGEAYDLEFFTAVGETIDVVTVQSTNVRPVAREDVLHVRRRAG